MYVIIVFIVVTMFLISLIFKSIAKYSHRKNPFRKEPALDQNNYILYFFYYNPDDTRTFVPKRTNPGFTVNFAKPGIILLALIFAGWLIISIS